jgi:hypothetical protein
MDNDIESAICRHLATFWPLSGPEIDFDNRQSFLLASHHCALNKIQ